jgi:hypothetical protein
VITVANVDDAELVWHPESQIIEQDDERALIFGDQKHSPGAEGIEVDTLAGGVKTRLNPNTRFSQNQALPHPALLSIHDLDGGSYSIGGKIGEVIFRDAERQFEDLFQVDDSQTAKWATSVVTKGFFREGYSDPIDFQPDDVIRMEASHPVRIVREREGSFELEGTFDKFEINNAPVGKTFWEQLSDSVRTWVISGLAVFLLVSLRINQAFADRLGGLSRKFKKILWGNAKND